MAQNDFDRFCRLAFDFLRTGNVRHLVVGGLAVVAVGEPRLTGDVDVVAFVSQARAETLIEEAMAAGFEVDPEVERERLRRTHTLRFRKAPFQLDLILASLPFEETAFTRSTRRRLFGRTVHVPTPEDVILFKVLAGRDKDLLDAVGIVRRHGAKLDRAYLRATLQPICDLAQDTAAWRRLDTVLENTDQA